MIELWLNNERCELTQTMSLSDALSQWRETGLINGNAFAIAINSTFVPRSSYSNTLLKNGDRIDLVIPMQGG